MIVRVGELSVIGIINLLVAIGCLILIKGSTKVCCVKYWFTGTYFLLK